MELTDRKKEILKLVIEQYISAAEPVGSKAIAREMGVSSATIRNEMAELAELGYLEQPHTSAGRVPSPKGYRLYVNELMEQRALSLQETEEINSALQLRMQELDSVLAKAGQVVSSIVRYPAYAIVAGSGGGVRQFNLLPVDLGSFIAVVMTDDGRVKSQLLHTEVDVTGEDLAALTALLNDRFIQLTPQEMGARLMEAVLPPGQFMALSKTIGYAGDILADSVQVYTAGTKNILKLPEFRDADKAHELMSLFTEGQDLLPAPVNGAGMQVLIGPENVNEALKDTSVVMASYDIGEHMRGLIGVVGPTRMDYASVAARLSYFAESLTRLFGQHSGELPPVKETKENE